MAIMHRLLTAPHCTALHPFPFSMSPPVRGELFPHVLAATAGGAAVVASRSLLLAAVHTSIYLCTYQSIYLSIYTRIYLSIYLSICVGRRRRCLGRGRARRRSCARLSNGVCGGRAGRRVLHAHVSAGACAALQEKISKIRRQVGASQGVGRC